MANPFITIVHNPNNYCKLLLIYDDNKYYYSETKSHQELKNFKQPRSIEIYEDEIIVHSKNNKHLLVINKR